MENLIQHFLDHHDHLLYAIAGVALVLELGLLGISGPLLFFAIAAILTGLLVTLGLINGWELEILSLGVFTALTAVVLWKPLKNFQNTHVPANTSSDMIGRELPVTQTVSRLQGGVSYSGIEWQARLEPGVNDNIDAGTIVKVVAVDGSLLIVKKQ
jgi:inner membrane protein